MAHNKVLGHSRLRLMKEQSGKFIGLQGSNYGHKDLAVGQIFGSRLVLIRVMFLLGVI